MPELKPTIVFLSTYPPRECGIATFTQDLLSNSQKFLGSSINCKVAAFNLSPLDTYKYPPEVGWEIDQNNKKEHLNFAKLVNEDQNITGVIIQHEYGIFGGEDGENILVFIQNCQKPMLVTLHTVLPAPSPKMKEVTAKIVKFARSIVVLTQNSKNIMEQVYPESLAKVFVIPHGIHPVPFSTPEKFKEKLELKNRIILSTFGLLSRGKGIEYALNALPKVIKKYPSVLYLILGETHPVVRRKEGEKYRIELASLIAKLKIAKHVKFYDQYLSLPDLLEFLKATDIYISTSTNPNQSVSGTFSYAVGTGRAVISTEFAQAKEIITPDTGRLVPLKDSAALTAALLDLLSDDNRLKEMDLKAYKNSRSMLWSNVAKNYVSLLSLTAIPPLNLSHLKKMTDIFGLFQFATYSIPNKDFGYTLDDNARALILCSWQIKLSYSQELEDLITIYLNFIKKCQKPDGTFINYLSYQNRTPTDQNNNEDLEDSNSRALWALGEIISNQTLPKNLRKLASKIFEQALSGNFKLTHLRSKAFAIKSFAKLMKDKSVEHPKLLKYIKEYADSLLKALRAHTSDSWQWFEGELNYNNALLAESLLIAGSVTKNSEYTDKGLLALKFLISKTFSENMYLPIGHSGWYKNNQKRNYYDQQPEDPASMILALVSAYNVTGAEAYKKLAKICFSWFLGNNSLKTPLYNPKTGGCFDGLHPDRVNLNQGAESLVSYLMSNLALRGLN